MTRLYEPLFKKLHVLDMDLSALETRVAAVQAATEELLKPKQPPSSWSIPRYEQEKGRIEGRQGSLSPENTAQMKRIRQDILTAIAVLSTEAMQHDFNDEIVRQAYP